MSRPPWTASPWTMSLGCWRRASSTRRGGYRRPAGGEAPSRTLYLIMIRFTILRIIDSSTLRIFDHENWPNISRKTLAKLVKRETLRLSKNWKETFVDWILIFHFSVRLRASCTAPCWCGPSTGSGPASTRASRRPSQSSFLRSSLSTWGIIVHSLDTFADICLSRVREFLSYVVPSNTLSSEEFKARCIDVMTGSVRRTEEVSSSLFIVNNCLTRRFI